MKKRRKTAKIRPQIAKSLGPIDNTPKGFTELREAILVNPMMVYELLNSLGWLSAQSGLPLKKYSIHTGIHMPITKAYIIDSDLTKQLIHFYGSAEEIQGEEE